MLNLTATELPRFMACNGSIRLNGCTPFNTYSKTRDEGVAAHWVVEKMHEGDMLGEELIDRKAPNGVYVDREMVEHGDDFVKSEKGEVFIETDTSYSGEGWGVSGRSDRIMVDGENLYVDDYKYGWNVVEPEDNWTLLSHAIGFLFRDPELSQTIRTVTLRIFQPRCYHPKGVMREWSFYTYDLWNVYWSKLSEALSNPSDMLNTNPLCYRCKKRTNCPAAQISAMNAVDVSEQSFNSELSPEEMSFMLDTMKRAEKVIKETYKAYEDAVLHKVKEGVHVPNYSMKADLSSEQWKEGTNPEMVKLLTGVDISKPAVITPGQAKKKGDYEKLLEPFYERKNKGFKLVRIEDSKFARQLFGDKNE